MIFTSQTLHSLEQNQEIKKKYAGAGSWGQNKLVFIPVVVAIFSVFAIYFFYDFSKTDSSYNTWTMVSAVVLLLSALAIFLIQQKAKKQVIENIAAVPVCVAKKIYGNDEAEIYYCIYTTGNKRHDIDFIEYIANKIVNINSEPDESLKRKINSLFSVKFADANAAGILLPEAFTNGEKVYQRQYVFKYNVPGLKSLLAENNGRFAVLAFNPVSVPAVRQEDLL